MEDRISALIGFYAFIILAAVSESDTQFWVAIAGAIPQGISYIYLLKNKKNEKIRKN
jgi:hypothetical protein